MSALVPVYALEPKVEQDEGRVSFSFDLPANEMFFNRYVGTRGASVANNAELARGDTFQGGPFTVYLEVVLRDGHGELHVRVHHDPDPFMRVD